jgi:hypothetical protein
MTDDATNELSLIKKENENMTKNIPVRALDIDQHMQHIKGHRSVLSDPTLREMPGVRDLVLNHILEHIDALRNVDPALLALFGEQPIGPVAGSPPSPETAQGAMPSQQSPDMATMGMEQQPLPNMPNIPGVPVEALANPELQQQAVGNVVG